MATSPGAPPPPPSQRLWRANCPQCGAEVALRSAASALAVCSYCRSTLAREGDALRRLGQSAEVFEDYSPLQVGVQGTWNGRRFAVVGRLQWRSDDGASWNEWAVLFDDDGARAWLAEDNGRYVLARRRELSAAHAGELKALRAWRAGERRRLGGDTWSVASVASARAVAAEGELFSAPPLDTPVLVVDLRRETGEVGTLEAPWRGAGGAREASISAVREVGWSVGASVLLDDLQLQGLRDVSAATAATRSIECPSCGTPLAIQLESAKTVVCGNCKAVSDLSKGLGAGFDWHQQTASLSRLAEPLLALGSTGLLRLGGAQAVPWQVVGYQVRKEVTAPGDDPEPPWTEYLLYNRTRGFAFLVNTDEGWNWAVPLTGAPQADGRRARWQGRDYTLRYEYEATTTYVLGEFYWPLRSGQRSRNADYTGKTWRLSREEAGDEVTWSDGQILQAGTVLDAFGVRASAARPSARDVAPASASGGASWVIVIVVVLVILFILMADESGSSYAGGGTSSGGWSSGGHK